MQEVFEKIIEKLEEYEYENLVEHDSEMANHCKQDCNDVSDCTLCVWDKAIEIVKQAAAEYNNGWIPCSVAMPEERDSMFAKLKGTRKWNDSMFEKISEEVNVTISDENGDKVTTHAYTTDGKWKCDLLRFHKEYSVIAWQPLQEPYNQKFIQECANPVSKEEREE